MPATAIIYLYDSRYPVDRRGIMFPGDASIADYRALQRRLGITRQVVVQPSAYGLDNRPVLAALAAFGREARGVVVVDYNISDAELRRMHERGVRAIQFNFAPPGPTTPAMIEPLSRRVGDLGWHIEVNVWAAQLQEILPILARLPSPIVLEHLGHIPEPEGVLDPLFGMVRRLIDRGRTWVKLAAPYDATKIGPPTYADSSALARLCRNRARAGRLGHQLAASGRRSQTRRCAAFRPAAWLGARRESAAPHPGRKPCRALRFSEDRVNTQRFDAGLRRKPRSGASPRARMHQPGKRMRRTNPANRASERSMFQRGSRRSQTSQWDLSANALSSNASAASERPRLA